MSYSDPRLHPLVDDYRHSILPNSYSRVLDSRVQADERPYGYQFGEPSADTGDFNQRSLESRKEYPMRKGRAV